VDHLPLLTINKLSSRSIDGIFICLKGRETIKGVDVEVVNFFHNDLDGPVKLSSSDPIQHWYSKPAMHLSSYHPFKLLSIFNQHIHFRVVVEEVLLEILL
jgi:hypothetical protein